MRSYNNTLENRNKNIKENGKLSSKTNICIISTKSSNSSKKLLIISLIMYLISSEIHHPFKIVDYKQGTYINAQIKYLTLHTHVHREASERVNYVF